MNDLACRRRLAVFCAGMLAATAASAQPPLKPALQGLGFLVGHWSTPTHGRVAETGGSSTGEMSFTPEAGGSVLLRKDHVDLFTAAGKPAGGFDIIMMIYAEAGSIHADYADGEHIIHYMSATVDPGHAVTFSSAGSAQAPAFKLSYALSAPRVLDIAFAMAPPGSSQFRPVATGSATQDR